MDTTRNIKIVKLKRKVDPVQGKRDYILVGLKEKELEIINTSKQLPKSLITILNSNSYNTEEKITVIYTGVLLNTPNKDKLVYQYKQRKIDIKEGKEKVYRNYGSTPEQQAKMQWLVNVASDYRVSWNTAISACGSQYGIVLEIKVKQDV